eukprot:scaffold86169_cov46-Attheya_sp.AAC.2
MCGMEYSGKSARHLGLGVFLVGPWAGPMMQIEKMRTLSVWPCYRTFTFKNSAAEIAGAGVGHVLLKVNGVDVECPHHLSIVVGGIVAKPWVMNMYRSKAVNEIQSGLKVSVKVKQFSLQGARIFKDDSEPRGVKYPNQRTPWRYIGVIVPSEGLPIKIAASDLDQLQIIHETVRSSYHQGT